VEIVITVVIVVIVAIVEVVIKPRSRNVEIVQKNVIVDVVRLCVFLNLK
jgi:hypothetical protein